MINPLKGSNKTWEIKIISHAKRKFVRKAYLIVLKNYHKTRENPIKKKWL